MSPEPIRHLEYESMMLSHHDFTADSHRVENTLDRSAYLVLTRIWAQGPMSLGELSDALAFDISTMSRRTNALIRDGLIVRALDPEGGRARLLLITAVGIRRLECERERRISALRIVLQEWSSDDIACLAASLNRFNASVERLGKTPRPRPRSDSTELERQT
ncbi:MarR family winged helix-turn-helix transcriptional regulator [Nocardia noduli]|uniref:MarR family winged helix-turn-helix transcriptional regulator n=1 Tax=Nocardia noduli TaxID=2815722 RepID=UPI001C228724|nr:MarR family transcriptional regulator [Nocardia noduli]